MEVLAFQIVIFIIIIVAGLASSSARNITVGLIALFTFIMVFSSPLMIIQFATIIFAFLISKSFGSEKVGYKSIRKNKTNFQSSYQNGHTYPDPVYSDDFLEQYERLQKKEELKRKIEKEKYDKLSEVEKHAKMLAAFEELRENLKNSSETISDLDYDLMRIERTNRLHQLEEQKIINQIISERKKNK
ncbi:hypothetical protein [Gelidibacter japonicus]|uniref:hypothetical protein n=1 Tax=Gelidibacter japonicus TaxID=1962232 RepID=UPI002B000162|nr:hypothetical protein [Gelidibacter japonicus]